MGELNNDLEQVQQDLRGLVDRLDEIAFSVLRSAVANRETKRPELERRLTRARNALLRALPLLEGVDDGVDADGAD